MRVLLTGNRGRIGAVLQGQLEEAGHTVVGYDRADGHDILDGDALRAAAVGCDAVIHTAALLGRPGESGDAIMAAGVMGTWHALMAAQEAGASRVVNFSSVNAMGMFLGHGAPFYLPIDDDHPPRPVSPYGVSKRLGEDMCRYFTATTGIATICLRPPGVWFPDRYAEITARWEADETAQWTPFWEYGAFCDVRDVAAAAVLALTCPDPGQVTLNLCADDIAATRPSREMAALRHPDVPWRGGPEFDADPYRALLDNGRAKQVLGWQPAISWRGQMAALGRS